MKINALISVIVLGVWCLPLGGCANQGAFPSLAKRPFEKTPQADVNAPTSPPTPAHNLKSDPALLARISAATARARSGVPAFEAALPAARSAVADGAGSRLSESWINAQLLVTRLERTLEPARIALSDLDGEQRNVQLDPNSADGPALAAGIREVETIAEHQSAELSNLMATLNR
jgi:hypothetical protein